MTFGRGLAAAGVLLLAAGVQADDERTRHFPAAKCRYTLPTDEWGWTDQLAGKAVFAAVGPDRTLVALSIMENPPSARIDQKFADGFDKGFVVPGDNEKRGGRLATFLGLPCYQVEGRLVTEGLTTASRVFLANGRLYILSVMGAGGTVEQRPDFEAILGGFAFDAPPVPPPPAPGPVEAKDLSYRMGQIAAYCLLGAGVLATWRVIFRRGQPSRPAAR
jgi:hypothetical protein